jgi:predicted TIM-barrel fold metal-dependent hydrolase
MDTDGLTAEVLFPSLLFGMFGQQDHEVAQATFARYNDWLADFCSAAPSRLFPVACTQVDDVDSAIELMEAGKKRGHVGLCIPYVPEVPYSDARYDKLWASAQDLEFPITFHAGCRGGGPTDPAFGRRSNSTWYTLISTGMAVTISELILSRVCERFPRLMFVPTEFETGWLAHFLQKTDWITHRGGSKLPMKPSDYWRRNFRCTFEDDELGIRTRDIIGTETMMWANDYPHGDAIWPNSQEVLDRVLADCGPQECEAMLASNAVELYHLPALN